MDDVNKTVYDDNLRHNFDRKDIIFLRNDYNFNLPILNHGILNYDFL